MLYLYGNLMLVAILVSFSRGAYIALFVFFAMLITFFCIYKRDMLKKAFGYLFVCLVAHFVVYVTRKEVCSYYLFYESYRFTATQYGRAFC